MGEHYSDDIDLSPAKYKPTVYRLLLQHPKAKNSDNYLLIQAAKDMHGVNIPQIINLPEGFFESVRRTRAEIQREAKRRVEKGDETAVALLPSDPEVMDRRKEKEKHYREYYAAQSREGGI